MAINVSDNNPRVNYTATSGQTVFTVSFEFFEETDLTVYINGTEKTLTTDYSVTGGNGSTGTITLVTGATASDKVAIVRDVAMQRTTDFTAGQDINRDALNEQLDKLTALVADIDDRASRALQLNDHELAAGITLPATDDRKGKVLGFNEVTGDVQSGPSLTDVQSLADVSADIATLADIEDGTDATDAIQTAAGISSDITTVSGISSNVTTVAGISSDVTAVAADATDIGTVATNISSVNTVATNIADVITVANDLNEAVSEVVTVADDLNEAVSEIDTVAGSISNVDTVGTNIADVNTVAGISANVTTVSGISANTTTVAGIASNVTSVAGVASDVTTVAGISSNVSTVSGISTNVTTVAGLSSSVSTLALISSDITTVAGISANVTTVAGDTANIATIATNLNGTNTIGTVAGSISNVNSVGGAIADVSTVASNLTDVQAFANTYRIGATDPTTSLDEGDLFYNTTSNTLKVYSGTGWEQGVTAGSGFLPLTGGGLTGNLSFGDNDKAIFGAGSDLQVYHNGAHSFVQDAGEGNLYLRTNGVAVVIDDGTNNLAAFNGSSGESALYYGGSGKKLATTSTGIDVTGNVTADGLGIGTSSIDNKVNIQESALSGRGASNGNTSLTLEHATDTGIQFFSAAQTQLRFGDAASTGAGSIIYTHSDDKMRFSTSALVSFDVGGSETMRIDSSGNVGIGTSSPSYALDIQDDDATRHLRVFRNASGTSAIMVQNADTGSGSNDGLQLSVLNGGDAQIANLENTNLRFLTNSSERMRIDSSGNIGIGTTSPSAKAHIKTASEALRLETTDTTGDNYIRFDDPSGAKAYFGYVASATDNFHIQNQENSDIIFFTNASEAMRIDSSGNLLVGTTSFTGTSGVSLSSTGYVYASSTNDVAIYGNRESTDGDIAVFRKDGTTVGSIGTLDSNSIYIGSDDVYLRMIGVTDDIRPATSTGANRDAAIDLGDANARFKDGYFSGTVNAANFNTTSDATLKTNVETLTGSLDAVKALRGVSFDWIESGNSEVGVIAQEVEAVVPDVVSTNDQGIKSVKYGNLVGVLIEAIKEQQAQIDELKAKLGE